MLVTRLVARAVRAVVDEVIRQNAERAAYPPGLGPDDLFESTLGPVRLRDIPRTPDGKFDLEWIDKHCACDGHVQERKLRGE